MKAYRNFIAVSLLLAILLPPIACQNRQSPDKQSASNTPAAKKDSLLSQNGLEDPSIPGGFSTQKTLHFDSTAIPAFFKSYPALAPLQKDMQKFYADRGFAYAWYDTKGLIEQADNLYNRVINIADEGLPDKIPYKDSLIHLFNDDREALNHANAANELMLTAQYFNYARFAWGGLSESQTKSMDWFLPRKKLNLPALMDSLLKDQSSTLIQKGYVYRQYDLLRKYLARYRAIAAQNDWPNILPGKKPFSKGDSTGAIAIIRKKLFQFGDLSDNSGSAVYDSVLENGVKNYQTRLGIKQDAVIGPSTIRELNKPLLSSIRQIMVNMERSRWVPVSLDRDYLVVNIPAFQLFVFQKDSLLFSMNAVVGKSVHKTVIFNGKLQYVVFSPYWNVPSGIMKNEVLPGIRRNPNYLKNHNMEWSGKTVRQRPGPANPLGKVKFLFPNQYDIYLHDSPSKGLFNEDTRAFSHGCIRLADARKLAIYLLRNDPAWTIPNIDREMNSGKEKWVTLKDQVPVFIAYFTAWVDSQGRLNWRKDIYNRDERLAATLFENTKQPKK